MNIDHISKSLFVGAAIAGIGMSSGRAEIVIGDDVRQQLQDVTRRMLQSHRLEVDEFHKEHKTHRAFNYSDEMIEEDYSDEMIEEDVRHICDAIYGKNMQRRSFIELLNGNGRCDFFKEGALGVFLRYNLCGNIRGSLADFKREYVVFYVEDSEDHFYEGWYSYPVEVKFNVQKLLYDFVNTYRSTAAEPEEGSWVYEKWSDFCEQHKGLRYFIEPWIRTRRDIATLVGEDDIRSHIADEIFSGKYITKIEEILYEEIRRQLEGDNGMMMRFVKRMCNTNGEKEICRFVVACFHQYKKIKKAMDTNSVTLDTENRYERFPDVECRLRNKDNNKNAPLTRNNATEFSELIGNPVFLLMHGFLASMKADIANVPELVNKLFTDPVYWAPAPVSDKEGADSLKELEENDAKKGKDAPNAFLEEID